MASKEQQQEKIPFDMCQQKAMKNFYAPFPMSTIGMKGKTLRQNKMKKKVCIHINNAVQWNEKWMISKFDVCILYSMFDLFWKRQPWKSDAIWWMLRLQSIQGILFAPTWNWIESMCEIYYGTFSPFFHFILRNNVICTHSEINKDEEYLYSLT